MFNIKKKIYVVHDDEYVDFMYERCLVLHTQFGSVNAADDITENKEQKGVVGSFKNYDHLLKSKFNDDVSKFHEFLDGEDNLLIVVKKLDYARLYMEMQLELHKTYGVTYKNLTKMRDLQRQKDFMQGSKDMRKLCVAQSEGDSVFDRTAAATKKNYKPTNKMFGNVTELPLEVIYALYQWGNISKKQANTKIAQIAGPLLTSEVDIILESGRIALYLSTDVLKSYTDNHDIQTSDDALMAIFRDPFLTNMFCSNDTTIDYSNKEEVAAVKKLCNIIINKFIEFNLQPEVDQQELDFFFELFDKKDIEVINKGRVNIINTGLLATRQSKFNSGLIMAV